jgi:glycerol-3-phosphate acyltransferase PlsY
MEYMNCLLWAAIGYGFGSIPFAVIISKARGVDIFKVGSGNPGATNVMRSVGKKEGQLCFLLDALKGFVPVLSPIALTHALGLNPAPVSMMACCALFGALVGHSFSLWIGFRGGKGVATTVGGLFALAPWVMLVGVVIWLAVFYLSRYVSVASIVMAFWLPFGGTIFRTDTIPLFVMTVLGFIVVIRHWANIGRLLQGKENRFGKK